MSLGTCPICLAETVVLPDVNPVTRIIRGDVCARCQSGMSLLRESAACLSRAAEYLQRHADACIVCGLTDAKHGNETHCFIGTAEQREFVIGGVRRLLASPSVSQ